jgi:hypothetical protein
MRSGHWKTEDLEQILPDIDAIEIFNARCMNPIYNQKAAAFAAQHNLAGTVGSDAHTAFELGWAVSILPAFQDTASLKAALVNSQLQTRLSSPLVHLFSRYAVWYKKAARLAGIKLASGE